MAERDQVRLYTLKGRRTSLCWVRDAQSNWQTELRDGQRPRTVKDYSLPAAAGARRVRFFNPWNGSKLKGRIQRGNVILPPFERSIVVRME